MNRLVFWGTIMKNFGLALLFSFIVGVIFHISFLIGFCVLVFFITIFLVIDEFGLEAKE